MIFKFIFVEVWNYSRIFFAFVMLFILISLFYNLQFARLASLVDQQKPVPHSIAFEAFPFVVYNMYSGKIDDWNKYSHLKIVADSEEVDLTDLAVIQEDQFVNPAQKFLGLQATQFHDEPLLFFLNYTFDSSARAKNIYDRVSNEHFMNSEKYWGLWLKKYLTATLKHEVKIIKIYDCSFSYNSSGKPELIEQKPVYQFE